MIDSVFLSKLSDNDYKLVMKLRRQVGNALTTYKLIEPNDKIMVCLSGGKDSYTMLDMILYAKSKAPFNFDIVAVNLDQKQPNFPEHVLPNYLKNLGVEFKIIEKDTYSIVKSLVPEGKTMCSLCSRLRRGTLYSVAEEIGATKIALGHHKDDTIETFFLNMFFAGKLEAMPAVFRSDDTKHTVIRPLIFCREADILRYSQLRDFPIIPCTLCGSQPNMQRGVVKKMIVEWDKQYPNRLETIFTSLQNIHTSHLFDTDLYDFETFVAKTDKENLQVDIDNF